MELLLHHCYAICAVLCLVLSGLVLAVMILCGADDLLYGIIALLSSWSRGIHFAGRERLLVEKLHARESQRIAVFLPAWQLGTQVTPLLEEMLATNEYCNYSIFIGTYPNDLPTQHAVDELAAEHPQLVKVLVNRPGPSARAHCLNALYQAMTEFEQLHAVNFDIVILHDAAEQLHPQWLSLANFLIPRVDLVQIPRLAAPAPVTQWAHWLYADEQAEFQLKQQPAREDMGGFIHLAGSGCAIARRAVTIMEDINGTIFDEMAYMEAYRFTREAAEHGLRAIFVSLDLRKGEQGIMPLSARASYIAAHRRSPDDRHTVLREKTRQIIGEALQEWRQFGWQGCLPVWLNLLADRKVLFAAPAYLLAILPLGYAATAALGQCGVLPWHCPPITALWLKLLLAMALVISCACALTRLYCVTRVYGLLAGLLALPRMLLNHALTSWAVCRALREFSRWWKYREHTLACQWLSSDGAASLGKLHGLPEPRVRPTYSAAQLQRMLQSTDIGVVVSSLELIPRQLNWRERKPLLKLITEASSNDATYLRAAVARVCGYLQWPELSSSLLALLYDSQWVVRANAAHALLKFAEYDHLLDLAFQRVDRYAWEVLIRTLEQDIRVQQQLLPRLLADDMHHLRTVLLDESPLLRYRYGEMLKANHPIERIVMN